LIGAGSAVFSLNFVRDVCLIESLRGSTITLVDIDEQRLQSTYDFACRYSEELGNPVRFERTTNRLTALEGADFVINTALAGGNERKEGERALFDRCGYYRGLFPAESVFHQYELMLGVARDIERACPDAWLIQGSNPVYDGVTLITRETNVKTVGLCHGAAGGIHAIASVLGLEYERIAFDAPGLNHCVWLTSFRYDGEDALPLLDDWIETKAEDYWLHWKPRFYESQMSPAAIHMYKLFGLLPLGDSSRAIWTDAWWYHQNLENRRRWFGPEGGFDSEIGWQQRLDILADQVSSLAEMAGDREAKLTELIPPTIMGEGSVRLIDALLKDRRAIFTVNVRNDGALDGVPNDVAVEVQAVVGKDGIRPVRTQRLPDLVMFGAIMPQILVLERRLAAFLTADRRFFLQYLLFDHRTRSLEHAEQTLDALLEMPGNERMRDHFTASLDRQTGPLTLGAGARHT
jgi:alpha-galactosidase